MFRDVIQPLLTQRCAACHAGKNAQGNLDLSTRASAMNDPSLLAPGESSKSRLLEAISGEKPEMPKNGPPLSPSEIDSIQRWIDSGAEWPEEYTIRPSPESWWSLRKLSKPAIPQLSNEDTAWVRSPIDAFIIARLHAHTLPPGPPADRRTFIRRLYYDLIGLPPMPERVQAFERDHRENAEEILVDELLASPHFGERWGQHWLDVVHFGETHGYDKDKVRPNAWPYRDYVVRSLNSDKPYRQFIEEQVAGDVLHPNTIDGMVGIGFIAAGPFDFVGQIEVRTGTVEKRRVQNIDRDDMVSVTLNVFNSMTAQCARCHDHKFDPISQEDYYRLQAIFAGVDRADRPYDADPDVRERRLHLNNELGLEQRRLAEISQSWHRTVGPRLQALDDAIAKKKSNAKSTVQAPQFGYHSQIASHASEVKWVQVDLGHEQVIDKILLIGAHDDFAGIGAGFGFPPRFRVEVSTQANFGEPIVIADYTNADHPNPGTSPVSIPARLDTTKALAPKTAAQGVSARYVRITATKLAPRQNDFNFALAELMVLDAADRNLAKDADVSALDSIEAPARWARKNLVDGIFPHNSKSDASLTDLISQRDALLKQLVDPSSIRLHSECEDRIRNLQQLLQQLPAPSLVFAAASEFPAQGNFQPTRGAPRPIYVLDRGDETTPKQLITSGGIGCLPNHPVSLQISPDDVESRRRAQLARWIVDRENHLTWRSIANRVWSYHFGKGIVETTNDFGRMGSVPSHPELLDWMASELRDGNLSLKSLHRMIVLSATYRQSSANNPQCAAIDADNRMLWRMNRRRLDAEAIRDSVLTAAGRLRSEMGGPSFRPFRFEDDHSPRYHYQDFNPDDPSSHRRSIYRLIVRSVPDPWMAAFDCADPSISVDRRNETLTALQSLALLNNPFMLKMAEHFASAIRTTKSDTPAQIDLAYQIALQRLPTESERNLLTELARTHGLENVCRVLFNSNEFVFVD
jgi:hypothetical protein